MQQNNKTVAIVIPLHKEDLEPDERLSLRCLKNTLGGYPIYFAMPFGMRPPVDFGRAAFFPKKYFRCRICYSALLTSKQFYRAFEEYEYILIYQTDCLVFRDELMEWCARGYDYVSAPWIKEVMGPVLDWAEGDAVGNGGFSLRKVKSHLRVLERRWKTPDRALFGLVLAVQGALRMLLFYCKLFMRSLTLPKSQVYEHSIHHESFMHAFVKPYNNCEDQFFSTQGPKYDPGFRIPSVEEALLFSFDWGAETCFRRNGGRLPFGCHAWNWIEERPFWTLQAATAGIVLPPAVKTGRSRVTG